MLSHAWTLLATARICLATTRSRRYHWDCSGWCVVRLSLATARTSLSRSPAHGPASIELELCSCCRTYIAALPILLWSRSRWPLHETFWPLHQTPWPLHETPWPLYETPWGADTSGTTHAPWWDKGTNVYMWNDYRWGRLLQDPKRRTSPVDWQRRLGGSHIWWWFVHDSATESPPVAHCVCKFAYGLSHVQVPVYYSLVPTPRQHRPLRDSWGIVA